jgi:hypothetical protein
VENITVKERREAWKDEPSNIEVAMADQMSVVFAEGVRQGVCQRGIKFVLGEVLVVEHNDEN